MNTHILNEDINDFVKECTYWAKFKNKRVAVTGATGLIGSILVKCLDVLNVKYDLDMAIFCIVRNTDKARDMFASFSSVNIVSINDFLSADSIWIEGKLNYLIHAAAPTSSTFFANNPVETFDGVVEMTKNVLALSHKMHVDSLVYLSSLEVYGEILDDTDFVTEDKQGYINPLSARSSYSMGKRAAECLCYSYFSEYQLPIKIARLGQTFGAGVSPEDKRVFAYIARSAIAEKDVRLNTPGMGKRNYCYTIDAIDAILRILLLGENGEAYNVANEDTYISVRDMAEMVLDAFSPSNKVLVDTGDSSIYPPTTKVKMKTDKLESLGWTPRYDLKHMFERLIESLKL